MTGRSSAIMWGRTPPWEMTTDPRSLLSSSSFRTASWRCRGTIRDFLLSRAALPANSRISAARSRRVSSVYCPCGHREQDATYTRGQQRGRQGHRNRFAGRSCPSSKDGGYDRRGLKTTVREWSRYGQSSKDSHWRPALEDREEDLASEEALPLPPEDIVNKCLGVGWG